MQAMVIRRYGGLAVLEPAQVPRPILAAAQVLVQVRASSVNPVDWKQASGKIRLFMPAHFPHVPGYDVAGEVVEVGPQVSGVAVGDRVHARLGGTAGGAAAEFAAVGLDVLAPMPKGMTFEDAAALPLAGMTALQGLRDEARLPLKGATGRVLVLGASGGVGHLAVQIAHSMGATVVAVCSARNVAMVTALGAHEIVDYTKPDPYRGVEPCDVVLDCVGQPLGALLALVKPGGVVVSSVPGPALFARAALNALTQKRVRPVLLKSRAADLQVLDDLHTQGKLRVVVDSTHPLEQLAAAWERSMSGRAVGKIVIQGGQGLDNRKV